MEHWKRRLDRAFGCLLTALLPLLVVFGTAIGWLWWNSPMRPLYFWASDVKKWHKSHGFDSVRCVKARCSEEVFHRYARHLELRHRLTESEVSEVIGWTRAPVDWWTPPKELQGAYYFFKQGDERSLLAYADGYLYFDSVFF